LAFVAVRQPFDFGLTTLRFRVFGPDLATLLRDGVLHRAVGGRELRIAPGQGGVDVDPLDDETEPVVNRLLGLEFDLAAFYRWAAVESTLAPLTTRFAGFRPSLAPDPFEALVTSITAQQVSLRSAVAIRNRLIERFGEQFGTVWAFPTRRRLAEAAEDDLAALGFSRRKAEYVVGLARSELDLAALAALPDEEVKARIIAQRGLGEWTSDWFLARHLGRPHAWPAGDLALRKAVSAFYGDVDVRAAGARFEPFQNLTAHYLLATFLTP
jgi:DNA-3-methyladenine glycosylase II